MDNPQPFGSWAGNLFSVGAIISSVLGWVPAIAALVGLAYYLIQIHESDTMQRWLARRRASKIAKLKALVSQLEATQKLLT